jgi:hypothetical protein
MENEIKYICDSIKNNLKNVSYSRERYVPVCVKINGARAKVRTARTTIPMTRRLKCFSGILTTPARTMKSS